MAGELPSVLGVVGAGTMGSGIAQLGAAAGIETRLHDPDQAALEKGMAALGKGLAKLAEKGRLDGDPDEAAGRVTQAASLNDLAGCELVIEAAPERPDLKRELFSELSRICGEEAVLATNTSSIPVTSLAGAAVRPENVVGMHFFNPPPLMALLEVIPADQTGERALEMAIATGEAMGRRVIVAADGPGFLVNRCGRPFGAEALRIVQEGIATPEQVDRICRVGGGFRMGPFELMDLVGIDVGFEVAKSFNELSFGEHRWKPSPLQAQMVAAGRLGRKTGRGWYDYDGEGHYRRDDPEPIEPKGEAPPVRFRGAPDELRDRAQELGLKMDGDVGPDLVSCRTASLAEQWGMTDAVGMMVGPPMDTARLAELTRTPATSEESAQAAEAFFTALGLHVEWVGDSPGLVLRRIVCQLVNEAAFAVGEGVGSPEDVDAGLTLGLNHPRGPFAWAEVLSPEKVLETIDALWEERREERYRAAPLLRRASSLGISLAAAAEG